MADYSVNLGLHFVADVEDIVTQDATWGKEAARVYAQGIKSKALTLVRDPRAID